MNDLTNAILSNKLYLGCVTFGREIDKKTSFTLMDHAYYIGIDSFDIFAYKGGGGEKKLASGWLKGLCRGILLLLQLRYCFLMTLRKSEYQ